MPISALTFRQLGWVLALSLMASGVAPSAFSQTTTKPQKNNNSSNSQPAINITPSYRPKTVNPHGSRDGCRYCHQMQNNKALPIASTDVDTICLKCHNGKDARQEFHPIGRTFSNKQIKQPKDWPAPNGKLGCLTCHNTRLRSKDNPSFVRGYQKGDLLSFCRQCHIPTKKHERYNPHLMLDCNRMPIPRKCSFCHQSAIEQQKRIERTGEPRLRSDGVTLCLSCHTTHLDYFTPGHIGVKVPEKIKAHMAAFDETPIGRRVSAERIAQAIKSEQKIPKRLPLANNDTIMCSTCHNPHQAGLFPSGSILAYGAIQLGREGKRLQLRGLGKELCSACHNK
ncbi:MAG: hypothetical protein JSV03_10605 [Planctomycetota bacterium]|nr:MAG: hypothetical protein JSV03_10605 [Planctomycetota bacterium]